MFKWLHTRAHTHIRNRCLLLTALGTGESKVKVPEWLCWSIGLGQKMCLDFSVRWYRKTMLTFWPTLCVCVYLLCLNFFCYFEYLLIFMTFEMRIRVIFSPLRLYNHGNLIGSFWLVIKLFWNERERPARPSSTPWICHLTKCVTLDRWQPWRLLAVNWRS